MKNTLLEQAREKFPKDTLFLSATGNLKKPLRVTALRMSEVFKNTVVNTEMGVVYDGSTGVWATKV